MVTHEVLELVANAGSDASKPVIVANGSVAADREGYRLVLTIHDAEGTHERRLEAPSCDELGHAAALIVALAINPALLATHPDPGGESQPADVALPQNGAVNVTPAQQRTVAPGNERVPAAPRVGVPLTTRSTEIEPNAPAGERLAWRVGLSEFVALRTLPGTNIGTSLFGALQYRGLRIETVASQLRAEARSTSKASAGATFALYRLAAKACWLAARGRWEFGPCAGAEVGLVNGHGYGVEVSRDQRGMFYAASLGALLELRIASSSFVGITADAELPRGDRFELAQGTIFEPRISGRIGASLSAGW